MMTNLFFDKPVSDYFPWIDKSTGKADEDILNFFMVSLPIQYKNLFGKNATNILDQIFINKTEANKYLGLIEKIKKIEQVFFYHAINLQDDGIEPDINITNFERLEHGDVYKSTIEKHISSDLAIDTLLKRRKKNEFTESLIKFHKQAGFLTSKQVLTVFKYNRPTIDTTAPIFVIGKKIHKHPEMKAMIHRLKAYNYYAVEVEADKPKGLENFTYLVCSNQ